MTIRTATIHDVVVLNRLVNSAYRGESSKKGWATEADLIDGIRTSEAALTKMINKKNAVVLVAEEEAIKACVYLEQQVDAMYLGMLTVQPELQGKGLGAQLMAASEQRAKDLGCTKMKITVITLREKLLEYYLRKGYIDTGDREPFPDDPQFGIPKQPL